MADMRERVIKGLECCADMFKCECDKCPYQDEYEHNDKLMRDALTLLKAQEPRAMTLEEIPYAVFGWIEFKSTGELVPAVLEDVYVDCTVGCATIEDGHDYYDSNSYGEYWRCWTARPTDAQREATPWQ